MPRIVFLRAPGLGQGIRSSEILRKLRSLGPPVITFSPGTWFELIVSALRSPHIPDHLSLEVFIAEAMAENLLSKLAAVEGDDLVVHAETSVMGHAARIFSEQSGTPYVLDLHGLWGVEYVGGREKASDRIGRYLTELEKIACAKAASVTVVSPLMKNYVVSNYGLSPNKVIVVPNGGFRSPRLAHYSSRLTLVYGGVFAYWERVEDFVRISQVCLPSEFEFVLFGSGPTERAILRELRRSTGSRIDYRGELTREQSLETFSQCQLGIAPSTRDTVRQVAWPIKVMDYMSCGLPVITPRVGDWSHMVEEYAAGIVTETSTPEEFCAAARELRSEENWTSASRHAVDAILTDFLWENLTEPIGALYESLL